MSAIEKWRYFPIVKTRDAELKCFYNLSDEVASQLLPVYELTKSRKTKKTPLGDVHQRMKQISEIQNGRPFVLDLCVDERYRNFQIEQLLDENDGFGNWRYFLNIYSSLNIVPMVHMYAEDDFVEVEKFVDEVSGSVDFIALRLPVYLDDVRRFVRPVTESLVGGCRLIVFLDAEQIFDNDLERVAEKINRICTELAEISDRIDIVLASTSFPLSVAKYGDAEGVIPILEEDLYSRVSSGFRVGFGDYASINIEQVEIRGGTFVPRIDVPLDDEFIYRRVRRASGGYPACAKKIDLDERYVKGDSWGDKQIYLAKNDEPAGMSPSFWIAVRMNLYVSSRVSKRRA